MMGGPGDEDPTGHDGPEDEDSSFASSNGLDCVLAYKMCDFFVSQFQHLLYVPRGCEEEWARVFHLITNSLIMAIQCTGPNKKQKLAIAARWYGGMPQIFLRHPGRCDTRNAATVHRRLSCFLMGDYSGLIDIWKKDTANAESKPPRTTKQQTPERRAERGVKLMQQGYLKRAMGLIQGHGVTSTSNPAVRKQMLNKHPQEHRPFEVSEQFKGATPDLSQLHQCVHEAKPLVGVGPRRFQSGYIRALITARFTHPDAENAFNVFTQLGKLYLTGTMPRWLNRILGAGLLTPLIKKAPIEGEEVDARPTKAEDSDTALWCQALARSNVKNLREALAPQQVAVGVPAGCELLTLGLRLLVEKAIETGDEDWVMVALDLKNAHNTSFRDKTQEQIEALIANFPALGLDPLALAHHTINGVNSDIYTRSTEGKIEFLCESSAGGGQGNALTNSFFPMAIDSSLKWVEKYYPSIGVIGMQDDITLTGSKQFIYEALGELLDKLSSIGLDPNPAKFQVYGISDNALVGKPNRYPRPSVIDKNGVTSYGVVICGAALGDDDFVSSFINSKEEELCGQEPVEGEERKIGTLENTLSSIVSINAQAGAYAMLLSIQCRGDYILATHRPSQTRRFALALDKLLRRLYTRVFGIDFLDNTGYAASLPDKDFIPDVFKSRAKVGGSGYRQTTMRKPFVNALNKAAPQLAEYFPPLVPLLGINSFGPGHETTRWATFFASDCRISQELKTEIEQAKTQYTDACCIAQVNPVPQCILTDPTEGFGSNSPKLHKEMSDIVNNMKDIALTARARKLALDDPRRQAFLSSSHDKFSNQLFVGNPMGGNLALSSDEYQISCQNKLGAPLSILRPLLGRKLKTSSSSTIYVDQFGYEIKKITCVVGGDPYVLHNGFMGKVNGSLDSAGLRHTDGNGTFSQMVNAGTPLSFVDSAHKQGIIPDVVLVADNEPTLGGSGHERFGGLKTLLDVKTLSPRQDMYAIPSPTSGPIFGCPANKRADLVNKQYHAHGRDLDASLNTGGTIIDEMNKYGKDGVVVGLVIGAYGEFSSGVHELADLIATKRATSYMNTHNMPLSQAKSMFLRITRREWGLYAHRGWANLLLKRIRTLIQPEGCGGPRVGTEEEEMHQEFNHAHPDLGGQCGSPFGV